jgi:hypothetical protein
MFFLQNTGITPTTHKPIDLFLFDAGIAWTTQKPARIYFLMWILHHPRTNPNGIFYTRRNQGFYNLFLQLVFLS